MRSRLFAALSTFCVALVALMAAPAAIGQPLATPANSSRPAPVDDLLRRGQDLETQRRWGEALTHYEEALRTYPDERNLESHFALARLHYDLGRRYADRSFCESIQRLSLEKSLALYDQVLLKIETHYVERTNWAQLIERGTSDLDVALSEPAFLERNVPLQDRTSITVFRRDLRGVLANHTIATRQDARDSVVLAAKLAEQRLKVRPTSIVLEYLCGATNSLDQYSSYLTPDQLNEVYGQIEGNFVGLGVELKTQDGLLAIVRVITGSPAERAGVLAGDRILAVDGRSTRDMNTDQAANLLQGEEGSLITLTLASSKQSSREVTVRRQRVEVPSIDQVQMLDTPDNVGYLRLTCFQKTTRRDLEAALWKLHRAGMKSLIMDLRGNPGGLLLTSVEIADLFLTQGVIVSTHGRDRHEDFTYTAREEGTWRVPLVVIIDQDSASAAEIFSGAIRDHHRGTVVGTRSFGKGSVQGIFPLENCDSGLRLTTAKFYSPNGRAYSRVGVEPDIVVHQTARPTDGAIGTNDDAMLSAALSAARNQMQAVASPRLSATAR